MKVSLAFVRYTDEAYATFHKSLLDEIDTIDHNLFGRYRITCEISPIFLWHRSPYSIILKLYTHMPMTRAEAVAFELRMDLKPPYFKPPTTHAVAIKDFLKPATFKPKYHKELNV